MAGLFRAYKFVCFFFLLPRSSADLAALSHHRPVLPNRLSKLHVTLSCSLSRATHDRLYSRALIQRPFLTQCLSSAVLFGAGDVLAQEAVEKRGWERYDVRFWLLPHLLVSLTFTRSNILSPCAHSVSASTVAHCSGLLLRNGFSFWASCSSRARRRLSYTGCVSPPHFFSFRQSFSAVRSLCIGADGSDCTQTYLDQSLMAPSTCFVLPLLSGCS